MSKDEKMMEDEMEVQQEGLSVSDEELDGVAGGAGGTKYYVYCPKCRTSLDGQTSRCPKCGARFLSQN